MSPFSTAPDPVLSLFQSAAADFAHRIAGPGEKPGPPHAIQGAAAHIVAVETAPSPIDAPPAPSHSLTCAALGLDLLRALIGGNQPRIHALRDRLHFSECDPLWAQTLIDFARLYLPNGQLPPIPYRRHAALSDFIIPAPRTNMRIALLSDWGTGTDQARQVAALLAAQAPDLVIHQGDIYYAGTADECARHFLTPMRAVLPDTPLFTLCGNHDLYSGGQGYYGLLQKIGQPASYFCLRSPDWSWQILAADTGLHDRNPFDETAALTFLEPSEESWHADKLLGFPGQTILLSHHQPFSAFRQIGAAAELNATNPNLMASHARLAAAGSIAAWFWGHEHRLALYAPYRGIAAGRNIGYGAVPIDANPNTLPGLQDPLAILTQVTLDTVEGAFTHGFALLDTAPDALDVSYWALTRPGAPIHRERFIRPATEAAGDFPAAS